MQQHTHKFLAIVLLASLAACATSYQETSFFNSGGFKTTEVSQGVFQVSFYGNAFAKKEDVEHMALLRAGEVVLDKGFKYFTLLDGKTTTWSTSRSLSRDFTDLMLHAYLVPPLGRGAVYDAQKIVEKYGPIYKNPKKDN